MDGLTIALLVLALAAFALAGWMFAERARLSRLLEVGHRDAAEHRARMEEASARIAESARDAAVLRERLGSMERARAADAEGFQARLRDQAEAFDRMQAKFKEVIDASAAAAMHKTSEQFLSLAETKIGAQVKPISETLAKTDQKLQEIEAQRQRSFGSLSEQVRSVGEAGEQLRRETANLVTALRKPQVRGRYGEVQLRRVAELAGMRDYCDFCEQSSTLDADGRPLRPDMVVNLPNGRTVVVDAKTNIEAYLDALEAADPAGQERHLDRFAGIIADQAEKLAKKRYWSAFDGSYDFVVMFIPGDQFIDAALQRRADLLERAAQQGVILASPSTLIGLLRAVYIGWREQRLAESAEELFALGKELHERAVTALGYAAEVGQAIEAAGERYNRFVGSVDQRLMPTLRKFEERGAKSSKELEDLPPAEVATRPIVSLPVASREDA